MIRSLGHLERRETLRILPSGCKIYSPIAGTMMIAGTTCAGLINIRCVLIQLGIGNLASHSTLLIDMLAMLLKNEHFESSNVSLFNLRALSSRTHISGFWIIADVDLWIPKPASLDSTLNGYFRQEACCATFVKPTSKINLVSHLKSQRQRQQ